MNVKWTKMVSVFVVAAALGLGGCASMKATPSEGAGFVPMNEMSNRVDLPFNKVWLKAGVDWNAYRTIYIKDVNTRYLMEANWWQENFRREDMEQDVKKVAGYMKDKFKESFAKDPQNRFEVVSAPQPGALVLELALTELVPSNPVLEAASIAAPYGSGIAVQAVAKESGAKATVAFEAKISDAATGTVFGYGRRPRAGEGCTHQPESPYLVWRGQPHHRGVGGPVRPDCEQKTGRSRQGCEHLHAQALVRERMVSAS